ncbi:hypothetical protein [Novipirellula artificiosorum]|uniref:Uncharacterized protein n=1 Tax=Novipirellula artificiosorum TaxID=2528016 RepID=A0A5C6E6P4_9BACT|nr:hypothetical protein [Novipirellula artificiosorum]TWU42849.1 hypothetical protein Poly41_11500 [Novipirellula artificiosorum]
MKNKNARCGNAAPFLYFGYTLSQSETSPHLTALATASSDETPPYATTTGVHSRRPDATSKLRCRKMRSRMNI